LDIFERTETNKKINSIPFFFFFFFSSHYFLNFFLSMLSTLSLLIDEWRQAGQDDTMISSRIESMLEEHQEADARLQIDEQSIHVAAKHGLFDTMLTLLGGGAGNFDLDSPCPLENNRSPLALAACYGHAELVEYLLDECKCDVGVLDNDLNDVLAVAKLFEGPQSIAEPIIAMLESRFAPVTSVDEHSMAAKERAKSKRRNRVKGSVLLRLQRRRDGIAAMSASELLASLESGACESSGVVVGIEKPLACAAREYGYAVFETLGRPRCVMAPMVNASELPFRLLCKRYGADAAWTPMMHSGSFAQSACYRRNNAQTCADDTPVVVQFCANEPDVLVECANLLHAEQPAPNHFKAIELNIGCPQRIAQRGFFGSFLQDDMPLIYELVSEVRKRCALPILAKIRVLGSDDETVAYARMLERAGAAILTVHGRTREQKNHAAAPHANWALVAKVRDAITIPLICNGSVDRYEDIERCLAESRADAVMSATGLLYNPALFTEPSKQPSKTALAREYLQLCREHPTRTFYIMRNHIYKMFLRELTVHADLEAMLRKQHEVDEFVAFMDALEQRLEEQPLNSDQALSERNVDAIKQRYTIDGNGVATAPVASSSSWDAHSTTANEPINDDVSDEFQSLFQSDDY
jgi:tRNA-dihydrouridine synthase 1